MSLVAGLPFMSQNLLEDHTRKGNAFVINLGKKGIISARTERLGFIQELFTLRE